MTNYEMGAIDGEKVDDVIIASAVAFDIGTYLVKR
jgi:hypothetical protein